MRRRDRVNPLTLAAGSLVLCVLASAPAYSSEVVTQSRTVTTTTTTSGCPGATDCDMEMVVVPCPGACDNPTPVPCDRLLDSTALPNPNDNRDTLPPCPGKGW